MPKKVKVYSTMSCPYCRFEKQWLDENKIEHDMVFVDLSPSAAQEMVEKTGQMGVPVTEITGEDGKAEYVVGFDQAKLTELLKVSV